VENKEAWIERTMGYRGKKEEKDLVQILCALCPR
jgi:hypothetical protein